MTSPLNVKIVAKAVSHLGEREQPAGSNSGPEVDRYLTYVGIPLSLPAKEKPWCAAFASFIVGMTLEQSGIVCDHVRTGSSHEIVDWGIAHKRILKLADVQPGDLAIIRGGEGTPAKDGRAYFHTTIVESLTGDGVHTIEGNKNDRVQRFERAYEDCTFVRPYVLK